MAGGGVAAVDRGRLPAATRSCSRHAGGALRGQGALVPVPQQRPTGSGALVSLLVDGDEEFRSALAWLQSLGWELLAGDHVEGDAWRLYVHDPL